MLKKGHTIASVCKHFCLSRETFNKYRKLHPSLNKAIDSKIKKAPGD